MIAEINKIFEAHAGSRGTGMLHVLGNLVSFGLLNTLISRGGYEAALKEVNQLVNTANKLTFNPNGIHLKDPQETAFLHVFS